MARISTVALAACHSGGTDIATSPEIRGRKYHEGEHLLDCSVAMFAIGSGTARATCNTGLDKVLRGPWGFVANGHENIPANTSGAAPTPPPVLAVGAITFDGNCGVTGEEILKDKGTITAPSTCGSPAVPCFDPTRKN